MSPLGEALCAWVEAKCAGTAHSGVPVLFVSGAQGIGKSTAMARLAQDTSRRIAIFGIDDVYRPLAERQALARQIHPHCAVRGAPGTHDLDLARETLAALREAGTTSRTPLPSFDKAADDRRPRADWPVFEGRPECIILEGWLMGVHGDRASLAEPPLNAVEAEPGAQHWRAWQEDHLAGDYAAFWTLADGVCHLDAPEFDTVLAWRTEQEETTLALPGGGLPRERAAWVARFIQFYERLTRRMLAGNRVPGHVIRVDRARRPEV